MAYGDNPYDTGIIPNRSWPFGLPPGGPPMGDSAGGSLARGAPTWGAPPVPGAPASPVRLANAGPVSANDASGQAPGSPPNPVVPPPPPAQSVPGPGQMGPVPPPSLIGKPPSMIGMPGSAPGSMTGAPVPPIGGGMPASTGPAFVRESTTGVPAGVTTTGSGAPVVAPPDKPKPGLAETMKDKGFGEGLAKVAGSLGGGGGKKAPLDLSMAPASNYDPAAQSRSGAAKLFAEILARHQLPGMGQKMGQPQGMLG